MALQASELKKYNYFSGLSNESLETVSQNMIEVSCAAGTVVCSENDDADAFYFVRQGRLDVTKSTKFGQIAKLSVLGSGQGFGEMALLTGTTRCCTVRATTAAVLFRLMKPDFDAVMSRETAFKKILLKRSADSSHFNKIKCLQPFILLEPDKMYALMARMTERTYSLGEDIIVQGEKGDFYYIVKSGRVAVLQKKKGESDVKQVAVLEAGDGFGEEALIRDDPRNATCRAIEETVVYALDKVDFDQILKSSYLDNIFAEDLSVGTYREKYVIIDARVALEYAHEHIEGAMSIPVEALRKKYKELDPGKAYITYCTNDARGMVAAFLLKNHGFNAKCLRGGISSWEGPTAAGMSA
mgnify:CR=1 FL=1